MTLLQEWPDEESTTEVVSLLGKSVGNLRQTLDDLSEIRRSDTDFARGEERVNFGNMVEEALLALTHLIHASQVRITTELGDAEVFFSRKNVRSIIYNLISNAIKYRSPDRVPEVSVRTERAGDYILLSIADNGVGIEPGKHKDIFERYERLRDDVEGTGVGLYIAKRMVEDMAGKIEVESVPGVGTTLKIYFKNR